MNHQDRMRAATYDHNREIFQGSAITPGRIDQGRSATPARAVICESNDDLDAFTRHLTIAAAALIPGSEIDGSWKRILGVPEFTIARAIAQALGIQASAGHSAQDISADGDIDARQVFTALGIEVVFTDEYLQCDGCGIYYHTQPDMYDDDPSTRIQVHPHGFGICHNCDPSAWFEAYAHQWTTLSAYNGKQGHVPDYPAGVPLPEGYRARFYILKDYGSASVHPSRAAHAIVSAGLMKRGGPLTDDAPPIIREAVYSASRFYRYLTVYTKTAAEASATRAALSAAGYHVSDTASRPA